MFCEPLVSYKALTCACFACAVTPRGPQGLAVAKTQERHVSLPGLHDTTEAHTVRPMTCPAFLIAPMPVLFFAC